jgi:hypothetical protein
MEIKVILVIYIFNFFIYLYYFLLHYNKITLFFFFIIIFYTELAQMKLDGNEDEILTIDVDSSDIPKSSGTESVNIS